MTAAFWVTIRGVMIGSIAAAIYWVGVSDGRHMTRHDIAQYVDGYWSAKHAECAK